MNTRVELIAQEHDEGLNTKRSIAKPKVGAVFGEIGCYVKMVGSRNKHQVLLDEHIGNHLPNCVTVIELCSGEKTNTTWYRLSEWPSKKQINRVLSQIKD